MVHQWYSNRRHDRNPKPRVSGKKDQINGISSALLLCAVVGKTKNTAVLPGFLQNRTWQGQGAAIAAAIGIVILPGLNSW